MASAPVLKSGDLQEDVGVLRSAYGQLHPRLDRNNSKADMDEDFAALSRQLDHDQSSQYPSSPFRRLPLKFVVATPRQTPSTSRSLLIEALFKSPTRLPFYFDWLDRRPPLSSGAIRSRIRGKCFGINRHLEPFILQHPRCCQPDHTRHKHSHRPYVSRPPKVNRSFELPQLNVIPPPQCP
jgi:hypothetical protein